MGRKSKLTPEQWAEVDRRLLEGEAIRHVAEDYPITEASIRARMAKIGKHSTVQEVAYKIVDTENALRALPPSMQITAQNLAQKLRAISDNLASAGETGTATARRLSALANAEVQKVDDSNPLSPESLQAMKGVAALTGLANESAKIGLNLLQANKDTVARINGDGEEGDTDDDARTEALARRLEDASGRKTG